MIENCDNRDKTRNIYFPKRKEDSPGRTWRSVIKNAIYSNGYFPQWQSLIHFSSKLTVCKLSIKIYFWLMTTIIFCSLQHRHLVEFHTGKSNQWQNNVKSNEEMQLSVTWLWEWKIVTEIQRILMKSIGGAI